MTIDASKTSPEKLAEMNDSLIIDNHYLRGRVKFLTSELGVLARELGVERMRLAACGVVALANTPESAAKAREMLPEYHSGSCDTVASAVDREMALRGRLAELEGDVVAALPGTKYMDPPDGGSVSLGEQVLRMRADLDAKQARIDALMLEFCPGEMTAEQIDEWGAHQHPV